MASTNSKIRLGLVGISTTYGWGNLSHLPAIKALPDDFELTAVCTRHQDTAQASAKAFGARLAFWDHRELVKHPDIDAVAIAVKVAHHKQIALDAIAAGKHVYCEWPLGVTQAEAVEIAAAARAKGLRTVIGLQGRSSPWLQYAKELIAEGHFGKLLHVNARYFGPNPRAGSDRPAEARRENGTHILSIRGIHLADMVCSLFGEFEEVSARSGTQMTPWTLKDGSIVDVDAPDWFAVNATLPGGAVASLHFAYVPGFASGWNMQAYGQKATLTTRSPDGGHREDNEVMIGRVGEPAMQPLAVPKRFYRADPAKAEKSAFNVAQTYALFAESIRTGRSAGPDFEDALVRYRMIQAIEESARAGGAPVRLKA